MGNRKNRTQTMFFGCRICTNMIFSNRTTAEQHGKTHQVSKNKHKNATARKKNPKSQEFNEGSRSFVTCLEIPGVETMMKMSLLTAKWTCNLCKGFLFSDKLSAENHVITVHRIVFKQDLISCTRNNVGKSVYTCIVCKKMFLNTNDLEFHYPKHLYLYDNEQSEFKDNLKKQVFIQKEYSCNLCHFIRPAKFISMHIWEHHNNELQTKLRPNAQNTAPPRNETVTSKNCNQIEKTEGQIQTQHGKPLNLLSGANNQINQTNIPQHNQKQNANNQTQAQQSRSANPILGAGKQTQINSSKYLIPKDLLKKVGITESSSTKIKWLELEQEIPEYVCSCCLCPHLIMFTRREILRHMDKHKFRRFRHFNKFITEVPLASLIKSVYTNRDNNEVKVLSCVCQHAIFDRVILSTDHFHDVYKRMSSKNNLGRNFDAANMNVGAEAKLTRLYQHQFVQHTEYRLWNNKRETGNSQKNINTEILNTGGSNIDGWERFDRNQQISDTRRDTGGDICINIDSLDLEKINTVKFVERNTCKTFIIMRNLLHRVNITNKNKTIKAVDREVQQLPEVVYSCFLCPHFIILKAKIADHMKHKHNLNIGYKQLLSAVRISSILINKETNQYGGTSVTIDCLCQHTVFGADVLSLPIIHTLYKSEMLKKNPKIQENVDTETKILQTLKSRFQCHTTSRLIEHPTKYEKGIFRKYNPLIPSHVKVLKLDQIEEIPDSAALAVTEENIETVEINASYPETTNPNYNDQPFNEGTGGSTESIEMNTSYPETTNPNYNDESLNEGTGENIEMVETNASYPETTNPNYNDESLNEDNAYETVFAVREMLETVGITRDSKTLDLPAVVKFEMPSEVFTCCLCPHTPMFSKSEVTYHLQLKHEVIENPSELISAALPIETLINADYSDNPNLDCSEDRKDKVILNCPCQYTAFSKNALIAIVDAAYEEMVAKYGDETDEFINEETKLSRYYQHQFTYHCRQPIIISPRKQKRKRQSESKTAGSKVYVTNEGVATLNNRNGDEQEQIREQNDWTTDDINIEGNEEFTGDGYAASSDFRGDLASDSMVVDEEIKDTEKDDSAATKSADVEVDRATDAIVFKDDQLDAHEDDKPLQLFF